MSDFSYETRAQTAGLFVARHLLRCIEAHAADDDPPEPDIDELGGDIGIQHLLDFSAALLGIMHEPGYEKRLLRFWQAMAEMLAAQGADLEAMTHAVLHDDDEHQAYVLRVKVKGGDE